MEIQPRREEASEIPQDVLFNILMRVPPMSFGNIRSVCKHWRSTTCDPNFAAYVANFGRRRPSVVALLRTGAGNEGGSLIGFSPHAVAISIGLASPEFQTINLPSNLKYHLSSSSNGLILLYDSFGGLTVVNPITGERPKIPKPFFIYSEQPEVSNHKCSLGFVPDSDEYKIVRIYCNRTELGTFNVEVHTLGTKSWRQLCSTSEMLDSVATVNGVMYWGINKIWKILSVDLRTEVVTTIPLPYQNGNFLLGELQGYLSCTDKVLLHQSVNVWLRKPVNGSTYVWLLQFRIPILSAGQWRNVPGGEPTWAAPMGIYEERFMLMKTDTCVGFFDMRTGRFKILYQNAAMFDAQLHADSLVSVKEMPVEKVKISWKSFIKFKWELFIFCFLFLPNILVGPLTFYSSFEH